MVFPLLRRREMRPESHRAAGRVLARFQIVEQLRDAVDISVLVIDIVQRSGEPHRIARIVALVKLLSS